MFAQSEVWSHFDGPPLIIVLLFFVALYLVVRALALLLASAVSPRDRGGDRRTGQRAGAPDPGEPKDQDRLDVGSGTPSEHQ